MAQRDWGSGGVYWVENRQRWVGAIDLDETTKSGRRKRATVSARTKREALQKLKARQRELDATSGGTDGDMTVAQYADQWLQVQRHRLAPSSYATTKSAMTKWVVPTVGHKRLDNLRARDIRQVATRVLGAGRAESTAQRAHSDLIKMLRDATRDEHDVSPGALLTEPPGQGRSDRDAIPTDHAHKILESAAQEPDFSRWVAAFYAALRPAEARGLRWSHVDFDRGLIRVQYQMKRLPYLVKGDPSSGFRVPRGYTAMHLEGSHHLVDPKTKSGDRWVPMVTGLQESLAQWRGQAPNEHDLVWPAIDARYESHRARPRSGSQDRAAWKRIVERAGVTKPDGTAYALYEARHTAATLLREAGATDEEITLVMGHSSILSTAAYIHPNIDAVARRMLALENALPLSDSLL